jgi:peptidylprolyl isomerase
MKVLVAALALAFALQFSGCGGSEETNSPPEEPAVENTETKAAQTEPPSDTFWEPDRTPAEEAQLKKEYADAGRWKVLKNAAGATADRLIIPTGPPPKKKIVIKDLRVGKGTKLDAHDQMKYEVIAFDYSAGEVGENNFGPGSWWNVYGAGEFSKAYEVGLKGMRVGGMRQLIVPASWNHDDDAAVYLFRLNKVAKE